MIIVIRSLASVFKSKRITFLSLLVLTGLIGVSIWDSVMIFVEYANGPRVTLVRTENIGNGSIPYLESMIFQLIYDLSNVFPEIENIKELEGDGNVTLMYYEKLEKDISDGTFALNNVNMSDVNDRLRLFMIFDMISVMDYYSFVCIGQGPSCITNKLKKSGAVKLTGALGLCYRLSDILRNGTQLENALAQFMPFFHKKLVVSGRGRNLSEYFFVHLPTHHGMYVDFETSRVINGENRALYMLFGPNYDYPSKPNITSKMSLHIDMRSLLLDPILMSTDKECSISLIIDNVGMFDKSATTECTYEQPIYLNPDFVDARTLLGNFVKECGCIQLSYRRHYRNLTISESMEKMPPYCDIESYVRCSNLSLDAYVRPQCITKKNQYQLSIRCDAPSGIKSVSEGNVPNNAVVHGHSTMTIKTGGEFYAIYMERFQLTSAQLIGQLGGDIGLYTGLSILSIWQLFLFLYNKYSTFDLTFDGSSAMTRSKYYQAFAMSILRNINEFMMNIGQEDHLREPEQQQQQQRNGGEDPAADAAPPWEIHLANMNDRLAALEGRSENRTDKVEQAVERIDERLKLLESSAAEMRRMIQLIMERQSQQQAQEIRELKVCAEADEERSGRNQSRAKLVSSFQRKKVTTKVSSINLEK